LLKKTVLYQRDGLPRYRRYSKVVPEKKKEMRNGVGGRSNGLFLSAKKKRKKNHEWVNEESRV
jgi:hypothetical protein